MIYVMIAWFMTEANLLQEPVVHSFKTSAACEVVLKELKTGRGYMSGKCLAVSDVTK